ncbi:MAG TPA: electron transfer flavoprotein subunit beta/FixA family protein [Candidatus Acidoferrum sp.]|nr:electron transfer flavoprotein subunit beta/FixA family protein [Candidatus Acidoferrum sp.]
MNIILCVKQVPGSTTVEMDPVTGTLKRDGAAAKLNPYDLFAIEAALCLKERAGGQVTALTMGPGQAKKALLETIWMGADAAVLVSDRRFAGADVLATARTLAGAVARIGQPDVIICGKQTTDGDTAQVGAELAELLGIPHVSGVREILEIEAGSLVVSAVSDACTTTLRIQLPCLLCMDGDINTPRLPSYLRMQRTPEDALRTLTLADLPETDPLRYGLDGSPTKVERIFPPEPAGERRMYEGCSEELAGIAAGLLRSCKVI